MHAEVDTGAVIGTGNDETTATLNAEVSVDTEASEIVGISTAIPAPGLSEIEIPASTSTDDTTVAPTTTTTGNNGEPSPSTLNRNTMVALRRAHSLPGEKYRDTESFRLVPR